MLFGEREVVWSEIFNSSPRHCWENIYEERVLDSHAPEYDEDGDMKQICTVNHKGAPAVVGKVPWLRFIHAFDGDFGSVKLEGNYEFYEDFTVRRIPSKEVCVIECHNPELVDKCIEALKEVDRQLEAISNAG